MVEKDELNDTTMLHTLFVSKMPTVDEIVTTYAKLKDDYVCNDCKGIWVKKLVVCALLYLFNVCLLPLFPITLVCICKILSTEIVIMLT